jgi:hypothetical protein
LELHILHLTLDTLRAHDGGCEDDCKVEGCHLSHVSIRFTHDAKSMALNLPNSASPAP